MRLNKSRLLGCCVVVFFLQMAKATAATCQTIDWPLWHEFDVHFIQDSGRVLDASTDMHHSSSEGQSYGMFFALVAGDRPEFDRLWNWTVNNLSAGDAKRNLPAWIWGKTQDGSWRVIDDNSASDANLWFAYALLEAGRLWNEPAYRRQANELLDLIEGEEVVKLPKLGPMLLPGKAWFTNLQKQTWQLNPSYLPIPLLRRLALERPKGPWAQIADNTATMIEATSPHGFAPDWTFYQAQDIPPSFIVDPIKGPNGSYDAIRTYLWAGMTSPDDPLFARVLKALDGMIVATRSSDQGLPPESVNTQTGELSGDGPFGFSAALMPYFSVNHQLVLLKQQNQRVRSALLRSVGTDALAASQPRYYDYVLSLFGTGWLDNMYRFRSDGTLVVSWEKVCFATTE